MVEAVIFETALNALNSIKTDKLRLQPDFADVFAYDNKGNDEILMSVRFQDLESGINYFRYMWIHASAVPGDAPQEVKDNSLSDRAGTRYYSSFGRV